MIGLGWILTIDAMQYPSWKMTFIRRALLITGNLVIILVILIMIQIIIIIILIIEVYDNNTDNATRFP